LRVLPVVVTGALWLCPAAAGRGQQVSLPTLTAAFLTNFVKFADWPDGTVPSGRVFTFCVAGDKAVFEELTLQHQTGSRGATVIYVASEGPFQPCQLLYLGGSEPREFRRIIDALQNEAVFTASDARGFAEAGGIAELRLENGKMRFTINPAAAQRAHIALSAKLLSLATLVKDTPHGER
jgi:hypothetical protein